MMMMTTTQISIYINRHDLLESGTKNGSMKEKHSLRRSERRRRGGGGGGSEEAEDACYQPRQRVMAEQPRL